MEKKSFDYVTLNRTTVGRRHENQGKNNQDVVSVKVTEHYICLTVNDGCSGCDFPEEAANSNVIVAEQLAENNMLWNLSEKEFKKTIARLFYAQLAETGYPLSELCSTASFVIINRETKEYIAASVGDSAVLVLDEKLNARVLLQPVNGTRKNQTIFTNDTSAVSRMTRYAKGKLAGGSSGFLLYTDGAECLAEAPYKEAVQLTAAMLLNKVTGSSYADHLLAQLREINSDDISFAAFMLDNETTRKAASASYNGRIEQEVHTAERMDMDDEVVEQKTKHANLPFSSGLKADKGMDAAHAEQKTKRAGYPFSNGIKTAERTAPQMLPSVLSFLTEPRTASDLMQHSTEINESNFWDVMIIFMHLGFVKAKMQDGVVKFQYLNRSE